MATSTRQGKRPAQDRPAHTFSCSTCYSRKVKCDKANPCAYCCQHRIECIPSHIATTNRPRKQRFPEAVLLAKMRRYEAALLSYGADLQVILNSGSEVNQFSTRATPSVGTSSDISLYDDTAANSSGYTPQDEEHRHVLSILDGEERDQWNVDPVGQKWYDRIFAHDADTSSFFFAVDPGDVAAHPAPFDMFKLWQIYCDNVHPLNKTIHAPTFQRKMSDYGAHLHLASPSDQALFFAVYVAAITSLSSRECEAIFFTNRKALLDHYKLATQVWLRRASLWRTSELSVLQAFVLFLSSIQNVVEPRSISCFTGVADLIARRMCLHRDTSQSQASPLEQEVRRRVWWELCFLDARAVERAGLRSNVLTGNWSVSLPSGLSDADLQSLQRTFSSPSSQPSSEMLFFLVRAEGAQFLADLRKQKSAQSGTSEFGNDVSLIKKLKLVDDFERRLQSQLLHLCDSALPHHRLTTLFAQMMCSRLRISIYTVEESICIDESRRKSVRLEFLQHCICNLKAYNGMRQDSSLECFNWFMLQNMPIIGYVHLLRLLQVHVSGERVETAWQVLQTFRSTGVRLVVDSLTMKAWKARIAASPGIHIDEPSFIKDINQRRLAAGATDMLPHLSTFAYDTTNSPSETDFMLMLDEILSGEACNEFDWSSWVESQ